MKARLCVLGLGYVGLPTAVVFASKGFSVVGVDVDERKVDLVNKGISYLHEQHLNEMLRDAVSRGTLKATTDAVSAVRNSEAVIIAVNTPVRGDVVDLSQLESALEYVRRALRVGSLVAIESTVPPGTTAGLVKRTLEESGLRAEEDFYLAYVPERVAPGRAIEELLTVPRVVGGVGPKSTQKAIELYSNVNQRLYATDATTAEFVKLIENSFRDLNIAFANLLALISERLGVDVYEAIKLANTHPRVNVHKPGPGVGGPCLTKDPYMLFKTGKGVFGSDIILLARRINDYMPLHTIKIIKTALRENGISIKGARIAILGAAYKGGVGDTRESPSGIVVRELLNAGADVIVYDPYTSESFGAKRVSSLEEAFKETDAVVVVTDHPEFKQVDLSGVGKLMRHKIIVDGRRVFDPYVAHGEGFKYYGIGFGKRLTFNDNS
ncbi:nucleotide sugar dehydrogenase [Infirmifilum sp.]|jgi:UDP-N-acetyl-D-mannosaminuronic acid dehydrogenase|uniref:nucleotide sugar dehydrogenase n=1 Tax=Infirmifilum sp. TaxID=2856575 RepID=UPI003D11E600